MGFLELLILTVVTAFLDNVKMMSVERSFIFVSVDQS